MESLLLIIFSFLMKCCLKLTLLWLIWFNIAPRNTRQLSFACRQFEILVRDWRSNVGERQTFLFFCKVHRTWLSYWCCIGCTLQMILSETRERWVTGEVCDSRKGLVNSKGTKYVEVYKQETWKIFQWSLQWMFNYTSADNVHRRAFVCLDSIGLLFVRIACVCL